MLPSPDRHVMLTTGAARAKTVAAIATLPLAFLPSYHEVLGGAGGSDASSYDLPEPWNVLRALATGSAELNVYWPVAPAAGRIWLHPLSGTGRCRQRSGFRSTHSPAGRILRWRSPSCPWRAAMPGTSKQRHRKWLTGAASARTLATARRHDDARAGAQPAVVARLQPLLRPLMRALRGSRRWRWVRRLLAPWWKGTSIRKVRKRNGDETAPYEDSHDHLRNT